MTLRFLVESRVVLASRAVPSMETKLWALFHTHSERKKKISSALDMDPITCQATWLTWNESAWNVWSKFAHTCRYMCLSTQVHNGIIHIVPIYGREIKIRIQPQKSIFPWKNWIYAKKQIQSCFTVNEIIALVMGL